MREGHDAEFPNGFNHECTPINTNGLKPPILHHGLHGYHGSKPVKPLILTYGH